MKAKDLIPSGLTTVNLKDLTAEIAKDRHLAVEVDRAASRQLRDTAATEFTSDITGAPSAAGEFNRWKRDQIRGLETVTRDQFFARVDTRVSSDRQQDEQLTVLVSRARGIASTVEGEGWNLVSWTSPITKHILDKPMGHEAPFRADARRPLMTYRVGISGRYEQLLPEIHRAVYRLRCGEVYVAAESELEDAISAIETSAPEAVIDMPAAAPSRVYEAAETFGLGDIVVLADSTQRESMLIPFGDSVLVEGPPGSGKTSIGIMRIACLIDQQWDALELTKGKDRPFHDYHTMRVLVFSQGMVSYLTTLLRSIGIERVPVLTTSTFLRKVCREAGTLSGREAPDRPSLARVKGRRKVLPAYWSGFRHRLPKLWDTERGPLLRDLGSINADFEGCIEVIDGWVNRVTSSELHDLNVTTPVNIAESLTRWARASLGGIETDPREVRGARELRSRLKRFLNEALDRPSIVRAMFETSEYQEVLEEAREAERRPELVDSADRRWRRQYDGEAPTYSEYDAMAAAWIGSKVSLLPSGDSAPFVGGRLDRLTHLVIDEVQDLSPCHLATLSGLIEQRGTLTLVGDLHQSLHPGTGLQRWEEAAVRKLDRRAFGVNYRQSFELGTFIAHLHLALYDEQPVWKASDRWHGPVPRIGRRMTWASLAELLGEECALLRSDLPGCTVGVLYDGRIQPKRLRWLREELEQRLASSLTSVLLAREGSAGPQFGETDCIIVASVEETKGLEFDAVVYIDASKRWVGPTHEMPLRVRNGLYVAASRARQSLSVITGSRPVWADELAEAGVCSLIDGD